MTFENNATRIRRKLLIRLAKLFREGRLVDGIDRAVIEGNPRNNAATRCCVHKDRAVTKYRMMASLGHLVEDEADELIPLAEYARRALSRQAPAGPALTVIDEACSACVQSNYVVTNTCRGCVARPCMVNCPKDAIRMVNGHATIDTDACVNCGRCQQVCPYHAIVYVPIPCEEACPVGAITKDASGRETIDHDMCINCGKCMTACPFGAVMERSQLIDVLVRLAGHRKVVALLAPAMSGQFPGDLPQLAGALRRLGFDGVVEVALGADRAAAEEAAELAERLAAGAAFMTTSCCPAYVQAARKHIPELADYVSNTPSPMHYTGEMVKQDNPEAITVFIGPCAAKRAEAMDDACIDYVLTAEELGAILVAAEVEVGDCEPARFDRPAGAGGRGFPVSGGVTGAIAAALGEAVELRPVLVDGLDAKQIKVLRAYARGKCPGNFVEVMSCAGGCVAGPCTTGNPKVATRKVADLAATSPHDTREPTDATA